MGSEFPNTVRAELVAVARGAKEIDLCELMMLLSRAVDDEFEREECERRLEALAATAREALTNCSDEAERVRALVEVLRSLGFRGSRDRYYDPRNSALSEVLERRTGIPVSLSVLFMEIGRRVGVQLRGVNFPFHFLLKATEVPDLYVDPFFCVIRDADSCADLLLEISGGVVDFRPEFLNEVEDRQVFVRVLRNLKNLRKQSGAVTAALEYCDIILEFDPEQPLEYRDRGAICLALGEWPRAVDDLSTYLAMSPAAADRAVVLGQLQYIVGQYNAVH